MGTELTRRGADTSPPLWSARAIEEFPDIVRAIHDENVSVGADVLTATTFRTHARNAGSPSRADLLTRAAVGIARDAANRSLRPVFVAGSLAPLEDCYRPDLVPEDVALSREHREHAERLAASGVDVILVETMGSARELLAAARAAVATGLPVVASMVTDGAGRLLSGDPIAEAVSPLLALEPQPTAFGLNCVPARRIGGDLEVLARAARGLPLAAYANTGRPLDSVGERTSEPIAPEEYAVCGKHWIAAGARLVGGCCGTTAAHTRALRELIDALTGNSL